MDHRALARKWRPRHFQEFVGQQHAVTAFTNALTHQRLHHAYLLTGTRGVGKTTLARILAKCLNCETGVTPAPCLTCSACCEIDQGRFMDLYEIDAASRTKVEDTRDLLDNVQYAPTRGRYKIYLIDEVHMLSGHSFNALLKTLEEPPAHVKFILATTDPQKLPPTILSRCLQFHLLALSPEEMAGQLKTICDREHIPSESEALHLLANAARGSLRDALSLLDQAIAYGDETVKTPFVRQLLGTLEPAHLFDLLRALADKKAARLLEITRHLTQQGVHFDQVLSDLISTLHQIALHQLLSENEQPPQNPLSEIAGRLNPEDVQLFYQIALKGLQDLPLAPNGRIGFEMTLLRFLAFYQSTAPELASPALSAPSPIDMKKSSPTQPPPPTASLPTLSEASDWASCTKALKLSGAALLLAQNCALKHMDDQGILLLLDQQHAPLLQEKYRERIQQALDEYTQKKRRVQIELCSTPVHSPLQQNQQSRERKHADALSLLQNDHNVQQIMETFDAKIIESSVFSKKG